MDSPCTLRGPTAHHRATYTTSSVIDLVTSTLVAALRADDDPTQLPEYQGLQQPAPFM